MEIRVTDLYAMQKAVALLATLDRGQFTTAQQQIIMEGMQAAANSEEARLKQNKSNKEFIANKRKEIPGYNYPKTQPSGRKPGRPRKEETETGAE